MVNSKLFSVWKAFKGWQSIPFDFVNTTTSAPPEGLILRVKAPNGGAFQIEIIPKDEDVIVTAWQVDDNLSTQKFSEFILEVSLFQEATMKNLSRDK